MINMAFIFPSAWLNVRWPSSCLYVLNYFPLQSFRYPDSLTTGVSLFPFLRAFTLENLVCLLHCHFFSAPLKCGFFLRVSSQLYNVELSFSGIWEASLWNVIIKEDTDSNSPLLWEVRGLTWVMFFSKFSSYLLS